MQKTATLLWLSSIPAFAGHQVFGRVGNHCRGHWMYGLNENQYSIGIFLDLQKAFEVVNYDTIPWPNMEGLNMALGFITVGQFAVKNERKKPN